MLSLSFCQTLLWIPPSGAFFPYPLLRYFYCYFLVQPVLLALLFLHTKFTPSLINSLLVHLTQHSQSFFLTAFSLFFFFPPEHLHFQLLPFCYMSPWHQSVPISSANSSSCETVIFLILMTNRGFTSCRGDTKSFLLVVLGLDIIRNYQTACFGPIQLMPHASRNFERLSHKTYELTWTPTIQLFSKGLQFGWQWNLLWFFIILFSFNGYDNGSIPNKLPAMLSLWFPLSEWRFRHLWGITQTEIFQCFSCSTEQLRWNINSSTHTHTHARIYFIYIKFGWAHYRKHWLQKIQFRELQHPIFSFL